MFTNKAPKRKGFPTFSALKISADNNTVTTVYASLARLLAYTCVQSVCARPSASSKVFLFPRSRKQTETSARLSQQQSIICVWIHTICCKLTSQSEWTTYRYRRLVRPSNAPFSSRVSWLLLSSLQQNFPTITVGRPTGFHTAEQVHKRVCAINITCY